MVKTTGAVINALRSVTLVFVIAGLAGATAITASTHQATAQEEMSAAVIEGTCDAPGDIAADLRQLTAAEGGALTSFTTVDLALEDLTGGEFAVVAGDPAEPTACGQVTGEGTDVYIAVTAQGDATIGGVAWLRARDARTQISLFLGEGLGSGSTDGDNGSDGDDDSPEPPVDETPEPPVDETPEPEPPVDETPEPSGDEETYTAPTYGYTVTYDTGFWAVTEDSTFPTDSGPADYLVLYNDDNVVQAEFVGFAGIELTPLQYIANWVNGVASDPSYESIGVRLDDEGNEIRGGDDERAFVALDFTAKGSSGGTYDNTFMIVAFQKGPEDQLVVLIFQTAQDEFEKFTPQREQLEAGMTFPE
jgi:hypothetical protein